MAVVDELGGKVGVVAACKALGVPRSSFYRTMRSAPTKTAAPTRPPSHRALSPEQRQELLDELRSERFMDKSPREIYAELLDDDGRYLGSVSTMYRVLREHGEVRERRNQLRHPNHPKPELVARQPNEIWSWDITKLLGPAKWTYFYLYVILDIFSRYVVGWMVAPRECAMLAKQLVSETCAKEGISEGELGLHADRGSPMMSKSFALLLADLGINKTHSRPRVSNDNPFSESQFKTLKYRPDFPERFGCIEDARAFCRDFFAWYNGEHHHSGLELLTPEQVHRGLAADVLAARQHVLDDAYQAHPERFSRPPVVRRPGTEVWINRPSRVLECDVGADSPRGPEAPAGGPRPPIAHATAGPTRAAEGNRAPGATRSRAQEVAAGDIEHGEHGEDATLPAASTLASCRTRWADESDAKIEPVVSQRC